MQRRYDMSRSDNYQVTGLVSYVCSGSGTLAVVTGFPVISARVSFATLPLPPCEIESSSSSSSSEDYPAGNDLPRIYVSSYNSTGFVVTYENIPSHVGYIEFEYSCQ
jgi:hypothetical protein